MRKAIHVTIATILLVAGILLLQGCLFIPMFNAVQSGQNAAEKVGNKDSDRPVRTGLATRDEVLRVLGQPQYVTEDRSATAYVWTVRNGIWVWPFCFTAQAQDGTRALILHFDNQNVLQSFTVSKYDGNWLYGTPRMYPITEGMHPRADAPPAAQPSN